MDKNSKNVIILLSSVFMTWGVITSANAILVPHFKDIFLLNHQQSMLVQVVFYIAPFLACIPTSILMNIKGYKNTLLYSLITTVVGMIIFYLMMELNSYAGVLVAIFFIAIGVASMQVVACPYIIKLTPTISSVKILSFTSSINSLGTVLAPFIIGITLSLLGISNIYMIMSILILLLVGFIYRANILNFKSREDISVLSQLKTIRYHKEFVVGAIAIFTYVGTEVAIGTITISYLHDPELGNVSMTKATAMIGFYWACAMIGRFMYSMIADKVNPTLSLILSASIAIILIAFAMYSKNIYGGIALILIGLCNSFLHPVIFASSIKKLGTLTGLGSAILIMCNVGGGVVPMIQASVIDMFDIITSYYIPILGYLVIISYALVCYTLSSKDNLDLVEASG